MKRQYLLLIAIFFTSVTFAFAQNKVEKYCQVVVNLKGGFSSKRTAKISFGDNKELFALKDTSVFEKFKLVNSLTTEVDVLNYMSKTGWDLVNVHALYPSCEVFYFKKMFDSAEFAQ